MKERVFNIGLTLIIVSLVACVISFYLLIFGIPIFLIGAVLVFLSKRTITTKSITIITPIIIYIPLTFIFLYIYNYSTPKTILIPKNFAGTLRVVYEEKCGNSYEEIDGTKILAFPENGILVLNEDFDRHINHKYYLVDELGKRTEITQISIFNDRTQKRPCVLFSASGTIGQTVEINSASKEQKGITFSDFYVYNTNTIDRSDFKSQQKFDSLTTEIVNQCRQQE